MNTDLLTDFIDGRLDLEIVAVTISLDGVVVQEASNGRLYTSPQRQLIFQYRAAPLPGHFPLASISNLNGLTIRGTTVDGWHFETFLFEVAPTSFFSKLGYAEWRAVLLECFLLRKRQEIKGSFQYLGIIDPLDCLFEKSTHWVSDDGKQSKSSLDWLQVQNSKALIEVRKGDENWSTVKVDMIEGEGVPQLNNEVKTILKALSLRMGKRVEAVACRSMSDEVEQLCFSGYNMARLRHSGAQPLVPLVMTSGGGSAFLGVAQNFFKTNQDPKILSTLCSVWDGELLSRENHRLQMAIAVEAIARYINKLKRGEVKTEAERVRKEEEEVFSKLKTKVIGLIDTIEWNLGQLARLKNVVSRTSLNDTGPAIMAAGEALGLSFSAQELQYWRKMRNPATHGEQEEFDPEEKDFYACQSILYRMVLALVGWTGPRMLYGLDPTPPAPQSNQKPVQVFDLGDIDEFKRIDP